MSCVIVICPFCSLLTYAHQVVTPKPYCVHDVVEPPVFEAQVLTQVKHNG